MSEPITLSRLEVRDLGGIHRFSAQLGQISIIVGENGAGKTTLLEAIRTTLEGGSDPDMIRNGTDAAEVTVELSTGHTAHKTIKRTGYELEVNSPDGGKIRGPATWLKEIAPPTSFDPIAFLSSDPKERAAFLLKTLPLTFDAAEVNEALGAPVVTGTVTLQRLNELRDGKYSERTTLNVSVRDAEGAIADMKRMLPEADGQDWSAERDRLADEINGIDKQVATLAAEIELEAEQQRAAKREEITAKIRALEDELGDYISLVDRTAAQCLAEQTGAMRAKQSELSIELGTARAKADQQQQAEGLRAAIAQRTEALKGTALKEIRLTNALKAIDSLKHRKLKELPIEGLDLKTDNRGRPVILIDGIPLDRLNRQQQLYVAIQAVSLAAGRMPLVLCEVAELDDNHLAEVAEACEQGGIQLVVARWMNGAPLQVMNLEQYMASTSVAM